NSMPNWLTFTLDVFNVVSLRLAPVRLLSLCCVKTLTVVAAAPIVGAWSDPLRGARMPNIPRARARSRARQARSRRIGISLGNIRPGSGPQVVASKPRRTASIILDHLLTPGEGTRHDVVNNYGLVSQESRNGAN